MPKKPIVRTDAGDNRAVNPAFGKIAQSAKPAREKDESDAANRMAKYNGWKDSIGDAEAEGDLSNKKALVNAAVKRGIKEGAFKNPKTGLKDAQKEINSVNK